MARRPWGERRDRQCRDGEGATPRRRMGSPTSAAASSARWPRQNSARRLLKNQAGNFVAPTPQTVVIAAAALNSRTPKRRAPELGLAPGANSYPLVNYEYAIVAAKQPDPATAAALRAFLLWAIGAGEGNYPKALDPLHFATLPEYVRALSDAQIREID